MKLQNDKHNHEYMRIWHEQICTRKPMDKAMVGSENPSHNKYSDTQEARDMMKTTLTNHTQKTRVWK